MKRFLLIITFLSVCLVLGFSTLLLKSKEEKKKLLNQPLQTQLPATNVSYATYHDPEGKFTLKFPLDWKLIMYKGDNPTGLLINEKYTADAVENEHGEIIGQIRFSAKLYNSERSLIDKVKYEDKFPDSFYSQKNINGYPAVTLEYTITPELTKYFNHLYGLDKLEFDGTDGQIYGLRSCIVYFKNDNLLVTIVGSSLKDGDAFCSEFSNIVETIEFDK